MCMQHLLTYSLSYVAIATAVSAAGTMKMSVMGAALSAILVSLLSLLLTNSRYSCVQKRLPVL